MTKLDKIELDSKMAEDVVKSLASRGIGVSGYGFFEDFKWLLKVVRKAEEMAKFYAEMPEKHIEFSDYKSMADQDSAKEENKIGYKAREFLSFLEKGE